MIKTHTEVLSSVLDGEAVDPEALRMALADVHAREALVDFMRLRAASVSSMGLPASLNSLPPTRMSARMLRYAWPLATAAIIVLVAITSALISMVWTMKRSDAPPVPSRVVRYVPGVDWHLVP